MDLKGMMDHRFLLLLSLGYSLIAITATADLSSGRCLSGWLLFNNFCYHHTWRNYTRNDARLVCESKILGGSNLVSILDAEETEFIKNQAAGRMIWLGLTRDMSGNFRWDDWSTYKYTNWGPYQPSNEKKDGCGYMRASGWSLIECNAGKLSHVCKAQAMVLDIDECASNPCQNKATCLNGVNSFTCTCVAGYEGIHCETVTNACNSNPCMNGGRCFAGLNRYRCNCLLGSSGHQCETDLSSGRCLSGWLLFNNFCYHHYRLSLTYPDSKVVCEARIYGHSRLVSILNAEETEFMKSQSLWWMIWLGLTRDKYGKFTWDDGSTYNYTNWAQYQVNTDGKNVCVYSRNSEWRLYECNKLQVGHICKAPAMAI